MRRHARPKKLSTWFYLISIYPRIHFTMEKESTSELSFLDVLENRKQNAKLRHRVYRKLTHTIRYLHKDHQPAQKRGVLKTLTQRATLICETKYLYEELKHLEKTL